MHWDAVEYGRLWFAMKDVGSNEKRLSFICQTDILSLAK